LSACAAAGLAHLDVKPDNVVVDAARSQVALVDFGSARDDGDAPPTSAYVASRAESRPDSRDG